MLDFREENGMLVARKAAENDAVAEVMGCLKINRTTDDILVDLRGEP